MYSLAVQIENWIIMLYYRLERRIHPMLYCMRINQEMLRIAVLLENLSMRLHKILQPLCLFTGLIKSGKLWWTGMQCMTSKQHIIICLVVYICIMWVGMREFLVMGLYLSPHILRMLSI